MSDFSSFSSSSVCLSEIDFDWVANCHDVHNLKKAIQLLKTEYFPELLRAAEDRLMAIERRAPIASSSDCSDAVSAAAEIAQWAINTKHMEDNTTIDTPSTGAASLPPVRGSSAVSSSSSVSGSVPVFSSSASQSLYVNQLKAKGNECFRCGEFSQSASYYSSALAISSSDRSLFTNLSMSCIRLKEFDRAIDACQQCIKLEPENFKAHWRLGQALMGKRKFDSALVSLSAALRLLDGRGSDANRKEIERMISECRKYEPETDKQNGNAATVQDRIKEEKEVPRASQPVKPHSEPQPMKRMIIQEEDDEEDDESVSVPAQPASAASAELREVRKTAISASAADYSSAIAQAEQRKAEGNRLFKEGKFEQAIELFSGALLLLREAVSGAKVSQLADSELLSLSLPSSLHSSAAVYYSNISLCYQQLQRFAQVVQFASRSIELSESTASQPLLAKVLLRRALAYESLGTMRPALADLQRLLTIEYSPAVAQHRERLAKSVSAELLHEAKDAKTRGNQAFAGQQYKEAAAAYGKGIAAIDALVGKQKSDNTLLAAQLFSNRALCLIKAGDFSPALEDAENALKSLQATQQKEIAQSEVSGLRVKSLYRSGLALIGLGRVEEAIERLEEADRLQPDPNTKKELEKAKQLKAEKEKQKPKDKKPLIEVLE